jgi:hypothetical protein
VLTIRLLRIIAVHPPLIVGSFRQAGQLTLNFAPHNVNEVLESAALLCFDMAASKGLELSWFVDPSLPPSLLIDATRLQQVLLNTLSNAIKVRQSGADAPGGGQRKGDSAQGAARASHAQTCCAFCDPVRVSLFVCSINLVHEGWRRRRRTARPHSARRERRRSGRSAARPAHLQSEGEFVVCCHSHSHTAAAELPPVPVPARSGCGQARVSHCG